MFRGKYGRYLDIDGDGIAYRTIPAHTRLKVRLSHAALRETNTPFIPKTATFINELLIAWRANGYSEGVGSESRVSLK